MKSKNKKSRIQTQKINSEAIQYSMLKLKEQKLDLSKTNNKYREFIKMLSWIISSYPNIQQEATQTLLRKWLIMKK